MFLAYQWLVLSLLLIVSFFLRCFPKSFLLTFYSEVFLEGWLLDLSSFKTFTPYLFSLSFLATFFLSFFPSEQNPFLLGWRFSQLLPFIVLHFGFPEVPPPCSWMATLSLLIPCCITGHLRRTYLSFIFFVFLGALFELSQSTSQLCCTPWGSQALGSLWVSRASSFH